MLNGMEQVCWKGGVGLGLVEFLGVLRLRATPSAQDDTFWWVLVARNNNCNCRSFDSAALRSG
jgi:hypothetical protein